MVILQVNVKYTDTLDKNKNPAKESNGHSGIMWVDKYKPLTTKQIIGQQGDKSNVQKLKHWLEKWRSNHSSSSKPKKAGYSISCFIIVRFSISTLSIIANVLLYR